MPGVRRRYPARPGTLQRHDNPVSRRSSALPRPSLARLVVGLLALGVHVARQPEAELASRRRRADAPRCDRSSPPPGAGTRTGRSPRRPRRAPCGRTVEGREDRLRLGTRRCPAHGRARAPRRRRGRGASTTTSTGWPGGPYLAAFETRLRMTCWMLVSSPVTAGRSRCTSTRSSVRGQRGASVAITLGTTRWSRLGSRTSSRPSSKRASTSRSSTSRYSRSDSATMSCRMSAADLLRRAAFRLTQHRGRRVDAGHGRAQLVGQQAQERLAQPLALAERRHVADDQHAAARALGRRLRRAVSAAASPPVG